MSFDPKAYLAKKAAPQAKAGFDPKAYLASKGIQQEDEPGEVEALLRGAAQGATLNAGDEIWGGLRAVGDSLPTWLGGDDRKEGLMDRYRRNRDTNRAGNERARKAHENFYTAGEIGGGAATMLVPGLGVAKGAKLATAAGKMALGGGLAGLGSSEAELTLDKATMGDVGRAAIDTGVGAAVGGVAGAGGHLLEKGLGAVGKYAAKKGDALRQLVKTKAQEEAAAVTRSALSESGRASTAAYKNVRNIIDAGAEDLITDPAERAVFDELKRELGESGLKGLTRDAATKKAAIAALKETAAKEAELAEKMAAEKLGLGEFKRQVGDRAKRYLLPAAGSAALAAATGYDSPGQILAAAGGGGLAGAGLRPMMHSLLRLSKSPASRNALWTLLEKAGKAGATSAPAATRALGAAPRGGMSPTAAEAFARLLSGKEDTEGLAGR